MSLQAKIFRFANFTLDTDERVLLEDGSPVSITPKALQLLSVLVECHGHIVEKEILMSEVWPDSFVEESNLTFNIRQLRKVLGDSKDNSTFIETVPRRGYRFIAPVVEATDGISASDARNGYSTLPIVENRPARRVLRNSAIPVLSVAVLAMFGTGIWFATSGDRLPTAPILSAEFSAEKLPTSGNSQHAVISPDGKYAAYTDRSGGKRNIWLRHLENSENIQIVPPSDDDYFGLTFSNNGDALFFVRKSSSEHTLPALYKVAAFGGVPVKVLENVIRPVSFSPDDRQISFIRCRYRKTDFCTLNVADADGGGERKLLTTLDGVHIHASGFSPDGKSIAFSRGRTANDTNDSRISEIDIDTGVERDISPLRFFDIKSLQWLPDGSGLLFSANDYLDGKASVWLADTATGKAWRLTRDAASYSNVSLDKAGNNMIAVQPIADFSVKVLAGGETKTLARARDLTFSNDGEVVYSTFDGEIWMINRDGSEQRQLTNNVFAEGSPRVSPDGRSIYFSSNENGHRHVWRMNADGTNRKQITTAIGGYPEFVTADERFVYYISATNELLYKVSVEDGRETLVHDKKLLRPVVSPDESLIAYFFLDKEFKIAVMRGDDKEIVKVLKYADGTSFAQRLAWSPDNQTLNYVAESEGRNLLWQQSLDNESPRVIADLGSEQIRYFTAAPAGDGFGYISGKWNFDVVLLRGLR